jgi:hypothetical protein
MHILSAFCRDVYRESSGEVLPKFYLGPGQNMENVLNLQIRGLLGAHLVEL